ncbi:MAG: hypothetical protein QOG31_1450 [Thermoplasmata archaeon]|jgi:hypothetical protein|nr:hypothetical protein [Thermoplasmata archaeon]
MPSAWPAVLLVAALLAGCAAPPPIPAPSATATPSPDKDTGAAEIPPAWSASTTLAGTLTAAGQAAVGALKVPDDPARCPFPGAMLAAPKGVTSIRFQLNASTDQGWLSMDVSGPSGDAHFPAGTQMAGPVPVNAAHDAVTVISVPGAAPGAWAIGLRPQGAFHGAFALWVVAQGQGEPPAGLTLKTC